MLAALLGALVAGCVALVSWPSNHAPPNQIQLAHPGIDWTAIYPGMTAEEIDALQREHLAVRYLYEPFTQFRPAPVRGRYVTVTDAGYRAGRAPQPWPPRQKDLVVFLFGGSTAFGFGVADGDTVASYLELELPGAVVYNFGRGYYFSIQERVLLESLLLAGHVPDVAVFLDGLNDFYYPHGQPELTPRLWRHVAPDLEPPAWPIAGDDAARAALTKGVITRYARNAAMIEAVAGAYGVEVLLVGQPVPWVSAPRVYPFGRPLGGHDLCRWGYRRWRDAGMAGRFGERWVWCGDALAGRTLPHGLYADSIHYSAAGSRVLARAIAGSF